MQPKYATLAGKYAARLMNLELFSEITGLTRLPADRQYWTLANEQPDEPGSEINQLVDAGFLAKCQFYGVDRDLGLIRSNKVAHPAAHWLHGEWANVVSRSEAFNPGLIYLDSVHFADSEAALRLLADTMLYTPPGTVLLFNAQSGSAYDKRRNINCAALLDRLPFVVPARELRRWRMNDIPSFVYTSSRAQMRTYALFKEN